MRSSMMGSAAGEGLKRAASAIDLEFDLMGLSQNQNEACDGDLFQFDYGIKDTRFDDHLLAYAAKDDPKLQQLPDNMRQDVAPNFTDQ